MELPKHLLVMEKKWRQAWAKTQAAMKRMEAAVITSPAWDAAFEDYNTCSDACSEAWAAYAEARDAWLDERRQRHQAEYRQAMQDFLMLPVNRGVL